MSKYAEIIVDISHEKVDRPFEYIIPDTLSDDIVPGSQVEIPFGKGNKVIKGFVLNVKEQASFDPAKLADGPLCRAGGYAEPYPPQVTPSPLSISVKTAAPEKGRQFCFGFQ